MFAFYAKWIFNFSKKVCPLNSAPTFPLTKEGVKAFNIRQDLIEASLHVIDENVSFTLKTDASDITFSYVKSGR